MPQKHASGRMPQQHAVAHTVGTKLALTPVRCSATLRAWGLVRCRCRAQLRPFAGARRIICAPSFIGRRCWAQVRPIAKDRTMRAVT